MSQRITPATVVTTRDRRGRLETLLERAGIDVVHIPLIEIVDAADPAAFRNAVDRLGDYDWLAVTSVNAAERIGTELDRWPQLKLAAVGTATADTLQRYAGRPVDRVPDRHTAADLVAMFPPTGEPERVVAFVADRALPTLVDGLAQRGYDVDSVVAYKTQLRFPSASEREAMLDVDAVAFASGSAAIAWRQAIGTDTPPIVVAIGPTTATVAEQNGLQVTHIAADHSVEGLAFAIGAAVRETRHDSP